MRILSEDEKAALKNFYTPNSSRSIFLIVILSLSLSTAAFGIITSFFSIGVSSKIYFVCIAVIIAIIFLIRKLIRDNRLRKAIFVSQNGSEGELIFNNISSNWGFRLNGAPQQNISLTYQGRSLQIKTFKSAKVQVYTIPRQIAYSDARYPNLIVPSGLFQLQLSQKKMGLMQIAFMLFWVVFVVGLFLIINHEMDSNSAKYAQPDALIYRANNKIIMATAITYFKPFEVSNKGVYGKDLNYAEAIDLSTGKHLWKTDFKSAIASGTRLLGQSDKYLFFLHNEIFVVDKLLGTIVARNKDFNINDKIPQQVTNGYLSDNYNFVYNDSLQALVIRGNDGLFYTIDGNTLQTNTIDIAKIGDPEEYFKNKFTIGNNYPDQISSLYDDGQTCKTLLDVQDTLLLETNLNGFIERGSDASIRRNLYSCSSIDTTNSRWTSLNSSVFLKGGFLVDATKKLVPVEDSISNLRSYQSLFMRYNHTNAPMRSADGCFIIMHTSTIEKYADIMLTGISSSGKILWQINTGYLMIPFMYKDETSDKLYISGDAKEENGDNMNQVTSIDLKNGKTEKYNIE